MNRIVTYRIYRLPFDLARYFKCFLKDENVLFQEERNLRESWFNVRAESDTHEFFNRVIEQLYIEKRFLKFKQSLKPVVMKELKYWPLFFETPKETRFSLILPVIGNRYTIELFERYCKNELRYAKSFDPIHSPARLK